MRLGARQQLRCCQLVVPRVEAAVHERDHEHGTSGHEHAETEDLRTASICARAHDRMAILCRQDCASASVRGRRDLAAAGLLEIGRQRDPKLACEEPVDRSAQRLDLVQVGLKRRALRRLRR